MARKRKPSHLRRSSSRQFNRSGQSTHRRTPTASEAPGPSTSRNVENGNSSGHSRSRGRRSSGSSMPRRSRSPSPAPDRQTTSFSPGHPSTSRDTGRQPTSPVPYNVWTQPDYFRDTRDRLLRGAPPRPVPRLADDLNQHDFFRDTRRLRGAPTPPRPANGLTNHDFLRLRDTPDLLPRRAPPPPRLANDLSHHDIIFDPGSPSTSRRPPSPVLYNMWGNFGRAPTPPRRVNGLTRRDFLRLRDTPDLLLRGAPRRPRIEYGLTQPHFVDRQRRARRRRAGPPRTILRNAYNAPLRRTPRRRNPYYVLYNPYYANPADYYDYVTSEFYDLCFDDNGIPIDDNDLSFDANGILIDDADLNFDANGNIIPDDENNNSDSDTPH